MIVPQNSIETSGIALPYDTQLHLWRPPVSDWVSDDLAVVVVNAEQLEQGRDLEGTFEDQVSSADLLLLNKIVFPDSESSAYRAAFRQVISMLFAMNRYPQHPGTWHAAYSLGV